jgi:protein ImuB
LLRLAPEEVVAAVGTQLRLWDTADTAPEKVVRAVARLGGLLGPEAVTVPEWRGGRQPDEHVATVPAGAVDLDGNRTATEPPTISRDPDLPPWPGRLPAPSPALVFAPCDQPLVTLSDDSSAPVQVDGRAHCSSSPAELCVNGNDRRRVVAWAGPWPVVERWWDPTIGRRQIRLQVLTDDGVASLLVLEQGQWSLAAVYD